ncbi:hypothetical protein M1567_01590 [Candidatus Marsarchaeota archaeon]|nr:hypothetical protein [Candidatus Marsarchaeota archaeon]
MNYAREHIKRYWIFAYRRALGISMFTFAIALAVGMLFTSMLSDIFFLSPIAALLFWAVLVVITILTLTVSFFDAHVSTIKFMNMEERHTHSKYTGIWIFSLVIGALVFILPAIFSQDYGVEPVILLFSFGGILWVLYASVRALFKHSYFEIAYGASVLWIIFVIGIAFVSGVSGGLSYSQSTAVTFISMASLIVVFASMGITMMFKSTKEFVVDFENVMRAMEGRPELSARSFGNAAMDKPRRHARKPSARASKSRKRRSR